MAIAPPKPGTTTTAAAPPAPPAQPRPASPWPRRIAWIVGVVGVAAIGLQLTSGFPAGWVVDFDASFDNLRRWVIENDEASPLFVYFLNPIREVLQTLLEQAIAFLNRMTFLGVIVGATAIAGLAAGWRMALLAFAGFTAMGLFGLWESSMQTLALMLVAVVIAVVIGIPLGVWAGRHDRADRFLRPILDAMQTIPAFSYLLPLVLLFSIGEATALISTVIFALPPAVRLTSLGVQGVPATALEVAGSFGSTARQTLRKVQLPMAKPSILLGVNQTIMMALGMVVIAAVVGFPGLGREVLRGLQRLDVGDALNAGIVIVLMAIVLDRVSFTWGTRDRRKLGAIRFLNWTLSRRRVALAAAVATILAIVIGRQVLRRQDFPDVWTISVADPTNAFVDWFERTFSGVTTAISDFLLTYALDPLRDLLTGVPWWMIAGGTALLAFRVSRRIGLAVMCFACLMAIGVLGTWDLSMDTLSQVLVAVVISVAIAVPLGIWSARSDRIQRGLKPILDAMQTLPAFVYLVPVIALFEIGRVPGVIASVIYALPPAIRLTDLGIRQVPQNTVEAALAYGATKGQLLRKVQLPLARPSILLGINQTIMMALSVVVIAGLIGAGALGFEVVVALAKSEIGRGLVAGASITLLAIVIDRITQAMGMERRSMRGPVGIGLGWWTRVRAMRVKSQGNGRGDV